MPQHSGDLSLRSRIKYGVSRITELRPARPTHVRVRVQSRTAIATDLGWEDAALAIATVTQLYEGPGIGQPDLGL